MSKTDNKKKKDKEKDTLNTKEAVKEEEVLEETEEKANTAEETVEGGNNPLEAELEKKTEEMEPEITAKTVTEFLTVADNLERALGVECADENFKKGVEMIYQSFMETLGKLGVEQIPSDGEFNPSLHQAVQQVPAQDGQESGMIASTFQKGYKLGDRILRFAMVAVVA